MVIAASALRAHEQWLRRGRIGDGCLVLRGHDARGQDLRSAQLSWAVVDSCNFDGARLAGATWTSAIVARSSFREAVFDNATLDDVRFVDCDFRDADFSDFDARAHGTMARCRFERCDLRGSVWLERNVAGASFVDCQLDLVRGTPRNLDRAEVARPLLSTPDGPSREVDALPVIARWQSGKMSPHATDEDKASVRRSLQGGWRAREAYLARGPRPPPATGVGSLASKWSGEFLPNIEPRPAPAPVPQAAAPAARPPAPAAPSSAPVAPAPAPAAPSSAPVAPAPVPVAAVSPPASGVAAREPIVLPDGSAPEASAWRAANGVTVYRDARSGFGMLLLPPVFLPPDDRSDLIVGIANTIILRVVHLPRAVGPVSPDEEACALVRRLLNVEPWLAGPGLPGVESTAIGRSPRDEYIREVAVIVGSDGETRGTAVLTLDYNSNEVDVATALTVWSALVSAVWFESEPREIRELIPPSVWWNPGFPVRLAASRPALPAFDADVIDLYVRALLDTLELAPPTLQLNESLRANIAFDLARLDVPDALQIGGTLATVHDVRGLAFGLLDA